LKNRLRIFLERFATGNMGAFWELMSRNGILKIICIVLAFAVWQGIRENTSFEVVVDDIPVVVTVGEGLAVLDQSTDVVSIRFRGSRDDVRFISREQVQVNMELSRQSGSLRQTIKFSPRYVKAPSRAHAAQFYPQEVTVTVDREVERVLPVKAALEGSLPGGVQLESATCEPASVLVRGAERRLLDLEQVRTAPVRLDGRYDSFKTHMPIAANGQLWVATPDRVSVSINLVEHVAIRQFGEVFVRPLLAADDARVARISPARVNVTLRGSPQRVQSLSAQDIYTYVDCSDLPESTEYEVPVRVDVPLGVQVEKVEPTTVQVTMRMMP
jgi:YbbR domain-containing protein